MALTLTQQQEYLAQAVRGSRKSMFLLLNSILNGDTLPTADFGAAGVATASKSPVLGASKNLDTLQLGTLIMTGLLTESSADALTAHAGGGQASALALTKEINRVTIAANAGDSVALPASAPGLSIMLINSAANPIQVFGVTPDTINDIATAVGVSQMPNSLVLYACSVAGKWYSEGLGTGYSGSLMTESFADGLAANSGGVQAGATPITTMLARFTTVTAGYSAVLPTAAPGISITVINASAASMLVFPAGSDIINTLAAAAAFTLPAGGVVTFYSTVALHWHTLYTNPTASLPFSQRVSIAIGSGVFTGANCAGAQFCTLLQSGATALTTPTAAAMLAAIPNGQAGMQFRLRIINTNGGTLTLTMDGTVTATGTLTLATQTWRDFDITFTSATAATMMEVGTGTHS